MWTTSHRLLNGSTPMALPGQKKTFALENCRDFLDKLEWEIDELKNTPSNDARGLAYRSSNAFVTAWHIADWVWKSMTKDHKESLRDEWNLKMLTKGEFMYGLRQRNRELATCREIATAIKHVELRSPDETVNTSISATRDSLISTRWVLEVLDGEVRRPVLEVLEGALNIWTPFIYERKISE